MIAITLTALLASSPVVIEESRVSLSISGGHTIGRNDMGRPVVLIAAALGVKPEVFREAFSRVTPARGGAPDQRQAQQNKDFLLSVLGKYGVTNERLDTVSNFYRFRPQNGELWRHQEAEGYAIVDRGTIQKIVITNAGYGYSTEPTITVAGFLNARLKVGLTFDKDLQKNGRISTITVG